MAEGGLNVGTTSTATSTTTLGSPTMAEGGLNVRTCTILPTGDRGLIIDGYRFRESPPQPKTKKLSRKLKRSGQQQWVCSPSPPARGTRKTATCSVTATTTRNADSGRIEVLTLTGEHHHERRFGDAEISHVSNDGRRGIRVLGELYNQYTPHSEWECPATDVHLYRWECPSCDATVYTREDDGTITSDSEPGHASDCLRHENWRLLRRYGRVFLIIDGYEFYQDEDVRTSPGHEMEWECTGCDKVKATANDVAVAPLRSLSVDGEHDHKRPFDHQEITHVTTADGQFAYRVLGKTYVLEEEDWEWQTWRCVDCPALFRTESDHIASEEEPPHSCQNC